MQDMENHNFEASLKNYIICTHKNRKSTDASLLDRSLVDFKENAIIYTHTHTQTHTHTYTPWCWTANCIDEKLSPKRGNRMAKPKTLQLLMERAIYGSCV